MAPRGEADVVHFQATGGFPEKSQTHLPKVEEGEMQEESIDFVFNARQHRNNIKKAAEMAHY